MGELIYRSALPDPKSVLECSAFTCAFPPADRDPYPPTTPAFIDGESGHTLSRADVRRLALAAGYGLKHAVPGDTLKRGDAVLIYAPNAIAWPLALFGAVAAGLVVSPANPAYTAEELHHQFHDSGSKLVFAHPALVSTVLQVLKRAGYSEDDARKRCIILDYKGLSGVPSPSGHLAFEDLLKHGTLAEEERFDGPDSNTTAFLCYSSGTTGRAKGVMSTHRNIVSDVGIITTHVQDWTIHGISSHIGVLPFYHIFGLNNLLHLIPNNGVPVIVLPRFDPAIFLRTIAKYRVTAALVVPPILLALLNHPETNQTDLSSLNTVLSGAAPLGAPLVRAFKEKLAERGADVAVLQGYGLTETSPSMLTVPRVGWEKHVGSAGTLMASLETRLVDDDGKDAPKGGPGELWVRGPTVMKGYHNNEAATKDSITPDGWFKTGDVATIDEHEHYRIVDRKKELIKYKGFQVPPAELESLLLQHPSIADAAVIGIDSPADATELPRAYIVHRTPQDIQDPAHTAQFAQAVQRWVAERVAQHKRLRGGVVLLAAIPKSPSGKILRRELRDLAARELASASSDERAKTKARL